MEIVKKKKKRRRNVNKVRKGQVKLIKEKKAGRIK